MAQYHVNCAGAEGLVTPTLQQRHATATPLTAATLTRPTARTLMIATSNVQTAPRRAKARASRDRSAERRAPGPRFARSPARRSAQLEEATP